MEFLLGLLLIGVAALALFNWSLAVRVARLEERIAMGFSTRPDHPHQPQQAQTPRITPTFVSLFENLIGGRLLIWVGGVALVVAAVFLIRYSIEIGLITPEMRMIAAALFGIALIALGEWAHYARKFVDDPRISQALLGAGLAVLYATVYGSYILYGFIGINTASALMLVITVAALALSLRHGPGTAAIGLIGGFLTPWLVGDPDAGALPLLAYLALLDLAVFAIAWRRRWAWLAGVAVLASLAWTGFLISQAPDDAIMGGAFALGLAVVAGLLRPAGTSLGWVHPVSIAAVELFILAVRSDITTAGWLLFAGIAIASVAIAWLKDHVPYEPFLVLVLGLLLLPVRQLFGEDQWLVTAATGFTLLFGGGGFVLAVAKRSAWWAVIACLGFAGPGLVMRWVSPDSLSGTGWGVLLALLATGPLALVFTCRKTGAGEGGIAVPTLLPALTSAALLAFAAVDLVPEDLLSIGWLALSIAFIGGGMAAGDRALRVAGLVLLTLTVLKLFLIDAAALEGVLRILSFFGLGASLIVLGRFYGTLLRAERTTA